MALLIDLLQILSANKTLNRFQDLCMHPLETQEHLLNQIIRKNAGTRFGRDHHFNSIKSFQDYQNRVPVFTYNELYPYVHNQLQGMPAQLTRDKPVFFATTSGTTGAIKYIPVTPGRRALRTRLMKIWHFAMNRDYPKLYSGKIMAIVSPEVESYSPGGTPCGAESGYSYRTMPPYVKSLYALPYEVFKLTDFDAKYYAILRLAAAQKISFIFTCNPSTVLLLARRLELHTRNIIRDVHNGTLSGHFNFPSSFRAAVKNYLKPDPKRAKALEKAAEQGGGRLLPKYVWPEIQMIACWKGGTVGFHVDQFRPYFPENLPVRDIGYFASEHFGSIPMSDQGAGGVLAIPYNVYEFYPADKEGRPQGPDLLRADQLEAGKRYYIYVTTLSGLYRYDMNDIIEVSGYYGHTPVISFIQKGKGVTSLTGEKLSETQVLKAVEEALFSRRFSSEFILAVGELHRDKPRYAFLVEFDDAVTPGESLKIAQDLDAALQKHNTEYAAKRKSFRLEAACLRIVKQGEFERYRKRMVEQGKSDGTFKILRLTTDTQMAKEFAVELEVAPMTT